MIGAAPPEGLHDVVVGVALVFATILFVLGLSGIARWSVLGRRRDFPPPTSHHGYTARPHCPPLDDEDGGHRAD